MHAPAQGWVRHLDGWQPGLIAVFLAGTAAALVVPRPVAPVDLPVPAVDARALTAAAEADVARARAAEREGLDADVRALGSAIRGFGRVDADPERTDGEVMAARGQVVEALPSALAQGDEALLRLRAYQLWVFQRAVRRWTATGDEGEDLRELGGDFLGLLRRNGWLGRGERRPAMKPAVLGVLFKKRWNAVAGLERAPFEPSLDELRALFGFLLAHPIASGAAAGPVDVAPSAAEPAGEAARAARRRRAQEQYRLKKIDELWALDRAYPRDLARGVVLYRLGKPLAAVEAFRRHLDAFPDGPHTLRAQNYLRAALGGAAE